MKTVKYEEVTQPVADIALLTAVPVEKEAVLALLGPLEGSTEPLKVMWNESVYYLGCLGEYPCVVGMCEKGSGGRDGSIQAGTRLIERWSPRALLLVGIGFGKIEKITGFWGRLRRIFASRKDRKQVFGDILVSTQVYPYEVQRIGSFETHQRGPKPESSLALINRAKNLQFEWNTESGESRKPIFGPLLSGDKLIDNAAFRDALFSIFPDAIGGEMEGYGAYAAAERTEVPWMIVKAVCDWADGYKHKEAQDHAARNAVEFVSKLLSEPGLDSQSRPTKTLSAERGGKELSSVDFILENFRKEVRHAREKRQESGEAIRSFLAEHLENGQPTVPEELKTYVETLVTKHNEDLENWLNVYEDVCGQNLRGVFSLDAFIPFFGQEVIELCEMQGPQRKRLDPRGDSPYRNIWRVYDLLVVSRRSCAQSVLKNHILKALQDFKIEHPEHVPGLAGLIQIVGKRMGSSMPEDLEDGIKSALRELESRGLVKGFDLTKDGWAEVDKIDL